MDPNTNVSTQVLLPPRNWKSSGLIPAVVLSFCFLLGTPGNIAVIILKPNWQNMSHLSRCLMLNLAVSDLLSLLTLPMWIYTLLQSWTFGEVPCKLLGYLVYCSLYGSLLIVTALSVQRYIVVVQRRRWIQVHQRLLMVLLWIVAMILSIPALVFEQLGTNKDWTYCYPQFSSKAQGVAVLLLETTSGFASIFVVAYSYICLHRKVTQAAFFNYPQTTRLLTSIVISNFVLWTPLHAINMLALGSISFNNKSLLEFCIDIWDIVKALAFLNNCFNPLLYAFTSQKICIVCQNQENLQRIRISQTQDATTTAEASIDI
ncbi:PREDICTED: atypical chemokine receptor 3-like [Cyprinodon variegatus]|uniref:atypical chemokine receptor 3-like n=1 Tax=Cyprinodon variegatus TaxID=28743 RepID=UPI000742CB82|nr:PREDICTED: atypical chemokine receptor 3-like [Cyprinodon variegatus]